MCTQARTPPSSRRKLSASSKSLAPSGSIVNAKRCAGRPGPARRPPGAAAAARAARGRPRARGGPRAPARSARRAEDALDLRRPRPGPDDDEVADGGVARALAVDGRPGRRPRSTGRRRGACLAGQLADESCSMSLGTVRRGSRASVRRAIRRPSSGRVSGSSAATTDGSSPRLVMSAPAGVRYLAVVSLSAPPPRSGATLCTEALPNVRSPTSTARSWSTRAPATISAALALPAVDEDDERQLGCVAAPVTRYSCASSWSPSVRHTMPSSMKTEATSTAWRAGRRDCRGGR